MDAVEQQRQKLLEEIQALPADVLQEAAEFVTRLQQKALHSETEQTSDEITSKTTQSPYEAFEQAGLIGCIKDAPPDLSVNYKAYLAEGLAEKYGDR
ncbi:MAG: hypothetical protein ACR2FS_07415 [Phormidesmis sp.]